VVVRCFSWEKGSGKNGVVFDAKLATHKYSDHKHKNLDKMIPMGRRRLGTPDDAADAALFLATNEYANNCILNLDGELSAI
jgi:NAD(P)-dependent dehydrogenase (short-subunit alcohol dehydrogenase family)